jgi:hypothetical protein
MLPTNYKLNTLKNNQAQLIALACLTNCNLLQISLGHFTTRHTSTQQIRTWKERKQVITFGSPEGQIWKQAATIIIKTECRKLTTQHHLNQNALNQVNILINLLFWLLLAVQILFHKLILNIFIVTVRPGNPLVKQRINLQII